MVLAHEPPDGSPPRATRDGHKLGPAGVVNGVHLPPSQPQFRQHVLVVNTHQCIHQCIAVQLHPYPDCSQLVGAVCARTTSASPWIDEAMTSQGSTPDANAGPRFPVATLLGIVFSAGFLWWFVRDIEAAEIGRSFGAISWPFVLLSALVLLSEFVLRALRWRLLLDPIRPTRFAPLFEATVIGAAGNTLLPESR